MHTQFFHLFFSLSLVISVPPPDSRLSPASPNGISHLVSRFSLSLLFPLLRFPLTPRFCVNLHSLLLLRPFRLFSRVCLWRSFSPATFYLPSVYVYRLSLLSFYYRCSYISELTVVQIMFLWNWTLKELLIQLLYFERKFLSLRDS